jgi:hypothetical protein
MHTSPDLRSLLRTEVGLFRARESRRVFDTSVHVGALGGPRDSFVERAQDLPAMDAALRADVVAALVDETGDACRQVWLTRIGVPQLHDLDLAWLAAARTGFGMHGRPLDGFYALTRTGWLDVLTGDRHTWRRLRL